MGSGESVMNEEEALQLHDRFARGEVLTAEENARLEAWYAAQDAAEVQILGSAATETAPLGARIHASLQQVAETARHIQRTLTENDSLRREIASLRRELAQQTARTG